VSDDKPAKVAVVDSVPAFMRDRPTPRTSLVDLAFRRLRNKNTRRAYMGAWKKFAAFHGYATPGPMLGSLVHVAKADAIEMIHSWRDSLEEDGLAPNTVSQSMRAISSVLDRLHTADAFPYTVRGLLEPPKTGHGTNFKGITHDEWQAMLSVATREKDDRGLRDRAVLLCLHDAMLRRFEVANLRVEDWDPRRREVTIVGKGRDHRETMPITQRTDAAIRAWVDARDRQLRPVDRGTGPLFTHLPLSKKHPPKVHTPDGIRHTVVRVAELAGVEGPVSPHRLRHAGGTYLARQRVAPDVLMRLMRHKNLQTTMIYIERASPEYANALAKMEIEIDEG